MTIWLENIDVAMRSISLRINDVSKRDIELEIDNLLTKNSNLLPAEEAEILIVKNEIKVSLYDKYGELISNTRILYENMAAFCANFANNNLSVMQSNIKFKCLFGLISRQHLVMNEIITLAENGLPIGATARWRTLYEIWIIMAVLEKGDNELAGAYWNHFLIEKAEKVFYATKDEYEKYMQDNGEQYNWLLKKYGNEYKEPYGWIAQVLSNKKERTIKGIAKIGNVYNENYHRYYQLSNESIHGSMYGNRDLLENDENGRVGYNSGSTKENAYEPVHLSLGIYLDSIKIFGKAFGNEYFKAYELMFEIWTNSLRNKIMDLEDNN